MRKYPPMMPGVVNNVLCFEITGGAESIVVAQVRWLGMPFCLLSTCCPIGTVPGSQFRDIAPGRVIVSPDTI